MATAGKKVCKRKELLPAPPPSGLSGKPYLHSCHNSVNTDATGMAMNCDVLGECEDERGRGGREEEQPSTLSRNPESNVCKRQLKN